MRRILKIISVLIAILLLAISVTLLVQIDFSNNEDLDSFLETKMKVLEARGMAVAFIRDGAISWSKNYGYADVEAGKEVDDRTIFQIASVSKPITGVAIMQLYEKGLIDLDASINRYLPFEVVNPNFPEVKITVRMLLQHKSSLIDNEPIYRSTFTIVSGVPDPEMTLEELARNYYLAGGDLYDEAKNFSEIKPPEQRSYSNIAFGLLGLVVEQVSGQPFNVYCNDNIFQPLGMTSTGWFSTEVTQERMSVLYDGETRLKPYAVASYPDGGLKTTVVDYAKFLIAMMNGGEYRGRKILNPATVREMMPENPEDYLVWVPDVFSELFVETNGRPVPGHLGGDPGISAFAGFNPLNGTGMIVFMNGATSLVSPSMFLMVKMANYRSPYKRLGTEAGLLMIDTTR